MSIKQHLTTATIVLGALVIGRSETTRIVQAEPRPNDPAVINITVTMPDATGSAQTHLYQAGDIHLPETQPQPIIITVHVVDASTSSATTQVYATTTVSAIVTTGAVTTGDVTVQAPEPVVITVPSATTTTTTTTTTVPPAVEPEPEPTTTTSTTTTTTTLPIETIDGVYWVRGCRIARDAQCPDWNLSGANLSNVRLDRVNFQGSNLTGTNLTNAIIDAGNFTNTNLTDVNLSGATYRADAIAGATLCRTTMTNGVVRNDHC